MCQVPLQAILLCHVEPGSIQGRTVVYGFERTEGIVQGLPRILEFADRLGVPMGLAMTPQALQLTDLDLAGHDVGLHIHPQDPVLSKRVMGQLRPSHDGLGRYPPADQARLIAASREIFEERTGRSPRLFVAGRWSEDAATAALLRREGFTHDGSALPGHRSPYADWSRLPRLAQPYSPSADDYQVRGSEPYVYLPVYQGLWGHHLTPEILLDVGASYFRAALDEARVGGADVVHMYLHSPLGLDSRAMAAFEEIIGYVREDLGLSFVLPTSLRPSVQPRSRPFPPAYWARMGITMMKSFAGRGELGRRLMGAGPSGTDWDGATAPPEWKPPSSGAP
ncbi:MAG TPA: hypothetical protein VEY12_03575 [Thermoplasmata archaeon]|nr:hypothetical protein [Thermoplasmata archaeon]